jgi:hypothetical protein
MRKAKKPVYRTMKVFDCQWNPGMPDDVKEAFFSFYEVSNDVCVEWTVQGERFEDENSEWALNKKKVDAWLIKHGAKPAKDEDSEGETVLIKHWW